MWAYCVQCLAGFGVVVVVMLRTQSAFTAVLYISLQQQRGRLSSCAAAAMRAYHKYFTSKHALGCLLDVYQVWMQTHTVARHTSFRSPTCAHRACKRQCRTAYCTYHATLHTQSRQQTQQHAQTGVWQGANIGRVCRIQVWNNARTHTKRHTPQCGLMVCGGQCALLRENRHLTRRHTHNHRQTHAATSQGREQNTIRLRNK